MYQKGFSDVSSERRSVTLWSCKIMVVNAESQAYPDKSAVSVRNMTTMNQFRVPEGLKFENV